MSSIFRRKAKCKQFYKIESRTLDIKGLSASLPEKFNLGLGSFSIDTKYIKASEELQMLDMLQYSLCGEVNSISNATNRDTLRIKAAEARLKMMEIVLKLHEGKMPELEDAFNFSVPSGWTFEQTIAGIAKAKKTNYQISGFGTAERGVILPSTELNCISAKEAIERLRFLSNDLPEYSVRTDNTIFIIEAKKP